MRHDLGHWPRLCTVRGPAGDAVFLNATSGITVTVNNSTAAGTGDVRLITFNAR